MKGLLLIILFGALAYAVYWACTSGGASETIQKKTQAETTGVVRDVARSGENLGHSTEKAFKSVNFGKR